MLPFAFLSYKLVLRRRDSWKYSWTGHALLLSVIFIILFIKGILINWMGMTAVILLLISGIGLFLFNLCYFIEHGTMRKDEYIKWYFVLPTHIFMTVIAILILKIITLSFFDIIIVYLFLVFYFIFMYNRLDVPWILYTPCGVSKHKRKTIINVFLLAVYLIAPLLKYYF